MNAQVWELLDRKGKDVVSVDASSTAHEAVKVMIENNIGCVLILTKNGTVSGICTERDIFSKVILEGKSTKKIEVRAIMTPKRRLITVSKSTTLSKCMDLITEKRVRHLPVVDEAGKLEGLISIGDVLKALSSEKELMIKQLERYIGSSL